MRRGVRAWACMWWTPTRGICHATERPLAVSRPVERLERMPGPRVTETKSGLRFLFRTPFAERTGIVFVVSPIDSVKSGRFWRA